MWIRSQAKSGPTSARVEPPESAPSFKPGGRSPEPNNKGNTSGAAHAVPPISSPSSIRNWDAINPTPGTPRSIVSSATCATAARNEIISRKTGLRRSLSHDAKSPPPPPSHSAARESPLSNRNRKRGRPSVWLRHRRARLPRALARKSGDFASASSSTKTIRFSRPPCNSPMNHSPARSRCSRVSRA